jgi:peptidoglycan L-alanyl-D-glutamate endopeptidase CwlK
MTEHRERLVGVAPDLAAKAGMILTALAALGYPAWVVEGVRSLERQKALYAQGRTQPGPIVTRADGTRVDQCTHSPQADGYGHAVDFAFQGESPWDATHPWPLLGAMARALGLTWGGDWKSLKGDLGHVEVRTV